MKVFMSKENMYALAELFAKFRGVYLGNHPGVSENDVERHFVYIVAAGIEDFSTLESALVERKRVREDILTRIVRTEIVYYETSNLLGA